MQLQQIPKVSFSKTRQGRAAFGGSQSRASPVLPRRQQILAKVSPVEIAQVAQVGPQLVQDIALEGSAFFIVFLGTLLVSLTGFSIYTAFGDDSLRDPFEEHED